MNAKILKLIYKINWKYGLIRIALTGLTLLLPVHAQYTPEYHPPPQLTPQQFEQELKKADAEYKKTGSARPYKNLQQKLTDTWDLKDNNYYELIKQVGDRVDMAKREHPTRNSKWGQIYHGERSLVPRF
ncbi:MAG: hypothetical protein QM520_04215 [Gammaproteobacteria bacterium]|nr:hypothetical protein [Gammaproteobacteria bacterium]